MFSVECSSPVSRELTKLMKIPVDVYNDVLTVLRLEHYAPLVDYFDYTARKSLSLYILNNALDNQTHVTSHEHVDAILNLVSPLVQDQSDEPPDGALDPEDFAEEQGIISRFIHLLTSQDNDAQYLVRLWSSCSFVASYLLTFSE